MNIHEMHNKLVSHYHKARSLKSKKSVQVQSIVGKTYKKKVQEVNETSPVQDFIRNEKHIAVQSYPLGFRSLPRRLKVYFPGPPEPTPNLQEVPYTYEIVPNVPFKMPKQKPGYVGDWILEESHFSQRKPKKKLKGIQTSIDNYRSKKNESFQIANPHERKIRFRSQVKRIAGVLREKNLSLKEAIKNKGFIKKPHNFYNSQDFFALAKSGDPEIEGLLETNQQLAFDIDDQQMTGLHWAARQGHANVCKILLQKYRAYTMTKDCYGRTPLHLAVMNKNIECIIRIFIEGGQLNAMNHQKKSVRMVAPDSYIRYLLEKLEQIKFAVKTKQLSPVQERKQLEESIRNALDESSLYF